MIRADAQRRGDDGFTLSELLVVVTLFGILGAIVASATISSLQSSRRAQDRAEADSQLRTALEQVIREVRVADPLLDGGTATSVSMDVRRGGGCERRSYGIAGGTLTETVQPYSATASTGGCGGTAGTTRTRTVLRGLAATSGFAYSLGSGAAAPSPAVGSDVAKVRITFSRTLPEGQPAASLTTEVELRNHR